VHGTHRERSPSRRTSRSSNCGALKSTGTWWYAIPNDLARPASSDRQ
jgi:hypothetical protein